MNILAACSGADSPVRKVVFKSSAHYYGCEQDDPAFFDEGMGRPHPPRTPIERDIVEAEASLNEFAEKNPDVAVSILRFANVLGPDVRTSHIGLFSLPAVPMILGFDPRYQFVHEDDVVHALEHAVKSEVPGVYNVAGDGVLALSEVAGPARQAVRAGAAVLGHRAGRRRRCGGLGVNIPPEALNQLRFGRGVDNRRYKAAGFDYGYTSREAVLKLGEHLRLHPLVRGAQEPYRYEREVEDFLRWSPHVKNARDRPGRGAASSWSSQRCVVAGRAGGAACRRPSAPPSRRSSALEGRAARRRGRPSEAPSGREAERRRERGGRGGRRAPDLASEPRRRPTSSPVDHYDDLAAEEVIALLASLEREDLQTLRDYERRHANRARVLSAIESVLAGAKRRFSRACACGFAQSHCHTIGERRSAP